MLALTTSIGLHWALLQSVAWVGMLAGNLQRTPLTEAVCRTFDGLHPCCLCKAIAECKKTEKKADLSPQLKKFEFLRQMEQPLPDVPTLFSLLSVLDSFAAAQPIPPALPPPRPHLT